MEQRIEEVRIRTADLKVGMYVSRLERPWLETAFPFQGILVRSVSDIQRLKEHGHYVYVDVRKGRKPPTSAIVAGGGQGGERSSGVAEYQRLYDFAGLTWNDQMKAYVESRSRNSASMIGAWRPEFHPEALAALRAGYSRFDLPWYQDDEQW